MPISDLQLLCAALQAYQITTPGQVPGATGSSTIGWLAGDPVGFLAGNNNINAGFVGETADTIVMAFRGTLPPDVSMQAALDWINDFDALLVPDATGLAGKVHQGFRDSRDLLWADMKQELTRRSAKIPAKKVYITGHSKGGAMAYLAAARLKFEKLANPIVVRSFAAARAGDPTFAASYNAAFLDTVRYEYQDDLVPHVPPSDLFAGFVKTVPEVAELIGHFNDGFESAGELRFIDWSTPLQFETDSMPLHFHRFASLARLIIHGQAATIAKDHSIERTPGYASAPYPP